MPLLVATESEVLVLDEERSALRPVPGLEDRPTCLAVDRRRPGPVWCGTRRAGLFRLNAGDASWRATGLSDLHVTAVAADPLEPEAVWVGTEPSQLWRSRDGGNTWERSPSLEALPSSSEWSFPPRPETHHVRWIAPHPHLPGRLWVAIEAGALVFTADSGRTWRDRVPGGPYDTHELAIHPDRPETLRAAAGDGYFESADGGLTWDRPLEGLDVGYLRSVAIDPGDPDIVLVSAATHAHAAYVAGRSDGRVYRREGNGPWERITDGWPDPPNTIAPLLRPGAAPGEFWAADERGIHRSGDGGRSWRRVAAFPTPPNHLRGLVLTG